MIGDISLFFQERLEAAVAAGVKRDRVILDPGLGFGKTVEHNLQILSRLREFRSLGLPILVGASRKGFIGKISGSEGRIGRQSGCCIRRRPQRRQHRAGA